MTTKIETTPEMMKLNATVAAFDQFTCGRFEEVNDLSRLADEARNAGLFVFEQAFREQLVKQRPLRGLRTSQLMQVNDNELITWAQFCGENNDAPEVCAEVERALPLIGYYIGGGGASPEFAVKLVGGLKL